MERQRTCAGLVVSSSEIARSNDAGTPAVSPSASKRALLGLVAHDAFERAEAVEGQHRAFEHTAAMGRATFRPIRFRDIVVHDQLHRSVPWQLEHLLSKPMRNACQGKVRRNETGWAKASDTRDAARPPSGPS